MLAPLYQLGNIGDAGVIIAALVIGFLFGYLLEHVGFGDARNIVAVFYFEDMRIFRVMFTAAITALILNFFAYYLGILDINLVHMVELNIGGLIAGGIIVGVGIILGGYCPGTALVAAATRKIDGMVFILGLLTGLFFYAELSSFFTPLKASAANITLSDITGISYGLLVFVIVAGAIAAFYVFSLFEGKPYADYKEKKGA